MDLKWEDKKVLKEIYYPNLDIEGVVKHSGMNRLHVIKLLDTNMFRNYTDPEGNKWKRCKICNVTKTLDKYHNGGTTLKGTTVYKAECKYCRNLMTKNRLLLDKEFKQKKIDAKKRRYEKNKEEVIKKEKDKYKNLSEEELRHRNKLKSKLSREKYMKGVINKAKEMRK